MAKTQEIKMRLTPEEKLGFESAAELSGISLSSWMRERLRLATIRELESAGLPVPFVAKMSMREV